MGFITAFLKAVFIILFGLLAIGLVVYGVLMYPEPQASIWLGTGLIVILMLGTAWVIDPHRSLPR
jgi:hypothetical protein